MNWALFSWIGYLSVALWLAMPLLWLLHEWWRPRRWLCHAALAVGVVALVLATINSRTYVNRIEVDRSDQIEQQLSQQELARRAAEQARADEAAQISFAEDASGDRLDLAGLDDADLKYFESMTDDQTPEWKKQKQERAVSDEPDDDLESMIGGATEREGMASDAMPEQQTAEPILMSDADKALANRLDAGNLMLIRLMLIAGLGYLVFDYIRRLNVDDEAYLPLPVPSRWADSLTPREPVVGVQWAADDSPTEQVSRIVRRGEVFVYVTDDAEVARRLPERLPRLPGGRWPIDVLRTADDRRFTDDFVFETLWFGRACFVVSSAERSQAMLDRLIDRLAERRGTRARTKRTVHIIWDADSAIADSIRTRFAKLGGATGFRLLIQQNPH
jgi:hypothetical protein